MLTKITKGLLGFCMAILAFVFLNNIFDINLFEIQNIYADGSSTAPSSTGEQVQQGTDSSIQNFVNLLNSILQVMYIILWPFIAIAGASMDNSLIYGEVFHIDKPLFMFRNMMKNFANYVIGFAFLITVVMYVFNFKSDIVKIKKMIGHLLIGGVLIQASWWLTAALIDISTTAVYGIGAMPLNILKDDNNIGNTYVNFESVKVNINSKEAINQQNVNVLKLNKYVSCVTKKEGESEKVDQKGTQDLANKTPGADPSNCVWGSYLIKTSCGEDLVRGKVDSCKVNEGMKLSQIMEKMKGMTGPLYTMYGSLLNFSKLSLTSNTKSMGAEAMTSVLKALVGIALLLPLLALAVVMIIRVVLLWVFIGFSPLIVMAFIFDFLPFTKKLNDGSIGLKQMVSLIFMPVGAVFAISISIIFLTLLNEPAQQMTSGGSKQRIEKALNIDLTSKSGCMKFPKDGEGIEVCVESSKKSYGLDPLLDIFGWLIINFFGIGLMWAIVFAALKGHKVTDKAVDGIHGFGKNLMKSAPIIPTPWGAQSVGSMGSVASQLQGIPNKILSDQYQQIKPEIDKLEKLLGGKGNESQSSGQSGSGVGTDPNLSSKLEEFTQGGKKLDGNKDAMEYINRTMGSGYKSMEEAYSDPKFWEFANKNGINPDKLASMYSNNSGSNNTQEVISKMKNKLGKLVFTLSNGSEYFQNSDVLYEYSTGGGVKSYNIGNSQDDSSIQKINALISTIGLENAKKIGFIDGYQRGNYKFKVNGNTGLFEKK